MQIGLCHGRKGKRTCKSPPNIDLGLLTINVRVGLYRVFQWLAQIQIQLSIYLSQMRIQVERIHGRLGKIVMVITEHSDLHKESQFYYIENKGLAYPSRLHVEVSTYSVVSET